MSAAPKMAARPLLLRASDVKARIGVSQTWLWRHTKDGTFPAPRIMPGGHRRWMLSEVEAWEASLPKGQP